MLKHEYPARWLTSMSAVVILAAGLLLLLSAVSPAQAAAPSLTASVTKVTNTSVSLSWTLSGASGTLRYYWVVYGVVGSATTYSKNTNRVTYANILGLTPGTTYWFQVKASTSGGLVTSAVINQKTTGGTPDPPPAAPADPSGLAATAASATSISLQWADNSLDETGFRIERAPGTTGSFTEIDTVGAGVSSYSNTGLTASTTYQYRVCAYNSIGDSGYSNTATATTPAPPPTIPVTPSSLTATAASASSINLQWADNSPDETGFKIERAPGTTGSFTQIDTVGAGVTSYSNSGLTGSTTFQYRVRAYNTAGNSAYTNTATATTPAPPPTIPVAPSGLTATAASASGINLQWADNSSDETGFKIERAPGTSGSFTQLAIVGAGVTGYSNTGLTAATAYCYRVFAYNAAGNSGFTNTACATTSDTVPAAPANLTATAVSPSRVDLQWADGSGNETSFKIERAPSAGGAFTQIATVGAGVTSYSNSGLTAATAYCYRVCAYNAVGNSGFSNTACATTPVGTPAAPGNLVATAVSSSRIDLQWADNASNESGFKVERAPTPAGPFVQIAAVGANVTSYSNTGLTASTTYYFRVCAWNAAGDSAYVTASATTAGTAPIAPGSFTAKVISTSRIDLSWGDNSDNETGFKLLRTAPDAKVTTFMLPANAVSYSDTGLTPSTTYAYQVCAYNAVGSSAYAAANATTQALPPTPPSAPDGLSAVVISDSEIRLSWRDTAWNETGFIIESLPSGASDFLEIARLPAGSETYSHQGLGEASQHCYRVCATNDGGQSSYTAIVCATTELKAPSNLVASASAYNSVSLTWTDNSAREANYVVERSTQGASGPWGTLATLAANSISYADQTCQPRTAYCYRVCATGSISDYSNVGSVVTPDLPIEPRWVGKTPVVGEAYWVAASGPYAYVTSSTGLQVVDISDPSNPLVKGSVDTVGVMGIPYPYDVATSGDGYVYVGSSKTLKVVDVQDPTSPAVVATLPMPDYAQGLCLSGNRAYVACYAAGVVIVDVTNPYAPSVLGTVDTPGAAFSVAVSGNTAVVADSTAVLTLDVTDPAVPSILGLVAGSAGAVDVDIQGSYAYAATGTAGLMVIDLQNPASPLVIGTGRPTLFGSVSGVTVLDGRAFVASFSYNSTDNGLQVFDVTNPAHPDQTAFLPTPGRTRGGIAVEQGLACIASGSGGLNLIDISDAVPALTARMPETVQSRSVATDGVYLYGLSYSSVQSRMYVYDPAAGPSPTGIGQVELAYPFDIALDGNGWAYVGDGKTLKVVDVHDPMHPAIVATLPVADYAQGVCVSGGRVYVACYSAGLAIVNVSNPYAPSLLGTYDTPGVASAVAVSGSTAVLADGTALLTLDVADPAHPSVISSVAGTSGAVDVVVEGLYAYVAAGTAGLLVVDIRNPGSPVVVGTGRPTVFGSISGVTVSGGRAFVASFSYNSTDNGLQVFDIANPAQPMQAAFLRSPGRYCRCVAVSGRKAYLTDDRYLVQVAAF